MVSTNAFAQQGSVLLSPLKQIQSGILPQDVKCRVDFVLIINSESNIPACVRPTTEQKLLERGWITPEKFEAMHPVMKSNENKIQQNTSINKILGNNTIQKERILFSESNSTVPVTNSSESTILLPSGVSTPTISSTKPGIKIISIGMSPDPLKVGDIPKFTLTWQNISDKPIYENLGCAISPLGLAISPSDVVQILPTEHLPTCPVQTHAPVYVGQIETSIAGIDPTYPHNIYDPYQLYFLGQYQIMKHGLMNMTMTLKLLKDARDSWDLIETIQFKVSAIQ
ncbi:MAG: hypothetical protein KGI25_00190, partial [Thaumarchaeota archaeon]|nr:hypothetical protein [Nitrososphaerota archaeon]